MLAPTHTSRTVAGPAHRRSINCNTCLPRPGRSLRHRITTDPAAGVLAERRLLCGKLTLQQGDQLSVEINMQVLAARRHRNVGPVQKDPEVIGWRLEQGMALR